VITPWDPTADPRYRRNVYLGALIGLAIIVAGVFAGYQLGHPKYLRWKSRRAVAEARVALRNHDEAQARMALRVAVAAGLSLDGYAAIAEYYEAMRLPAAVAAREAVLKNNPRDLSARLALISAALRFGDYQAALEAISGATTAEKKDLRIQSAIAILAVRERQMGLANYLFDQMQATDPRDLSIRFARDALLINHPKAEKAAQARQDLAALSGNPGEQHLPIILTLLQDALNRRDGAAASGWGKKVIGEKQASLGDLLLAADGLALAHPGPEGSLPSDLQQRVEALARGTETLAARYANWLITRSRPLQAAKWLDSLDPEFARQPRLAAARAEAALASGEWVDLEARLKTGAWGPFPISAVDFSFSAQTLKSHGAEQLALRTFQAGLADCSSSRLGLRGMKYLARSWRWPEAETAASGALVRAFPLDPQGYPLWVSHLRKLADTRALCAALDGWRKAEPANVEVGYDWALAALLIEPAHPPAQAETEMEKLYSSDPANPIYVTGAAFARYRRGRAQEAADLMAKLSPVALKRPDRAPYAAAIFAAAGRYEAAQSVAKLAPPPDALLPEERDLLRQALRQSGG